MREQSISKKVVTCAEVRLLELVDLAELADLLPQWAELLLELDDTAGEDIARLGHACELGPKRLVLAL